MGGLVDSLCVFPPVFLPLLPHWHFGRGVRRWTDISFIPKHFSLLLSNAASSSSGSWDVMAWRGVT